MNSPLPSVAYFDSTFEEALALAREARNFVVYQDSAEASGASGASGAAGAAGAAGTAKPDPAVRLVISCESMRVTARIGQVIAWLLVQKAVHAGDLTRAQAAEPAYRLAGQKVCEVADPIADEKIPARLVALLERSHSLYARVQRLDAALDRVSV